MFKKLISYFWPLTKRVSSDFNGQLEITWYNGQKLLDSQHTNYSYGNLQKVLAYGLSHLSFSPQSSVLLLGLGGGCVIETLRKRFAHTGVITAVEIDPVIVKIAQEEFNHIPSDNLKLITCDAFEYITRQRAQFAIIIVDLFIDNQVPQRVYSNSFWTALLNCLSPQGKVVFNAGLDEQIDAQLEKFKKNIQKSAKITPLKYPEMSNRLTVLEALN